MFWPRFLIFVISSTVIRAVSGPSSINSLLQPQPMLPQLDRYSDSGFSLLHSVSAGAQLALQHCQREFQWERWNCPDSVFSRKGRQVVTKEIAFVSAITAAGIIHTVARDCRNGKLKDCGADPLAYADKVAAEFLQTLERDSHDAAAAVNKHNYKIGRQVVRASVRQDCRCEGLCRNKICRDVEGSLQDITTQLRLSYKTAKRVEWNSVHLDKEFKVDNHQLLFISQSPDYCQPNNTTGWPGTAGRTCSRELGPHVSRQERRSCRKLCRTCGLSVSHRSRTVTMQCHCQFHWCCSVTCQQCETLVQQHFCE